jgi:tetratricopeptide (TPR) repeat protein
VSVFWVHASSEERFRQSYASIADECNIPGRDDPKVDVLALVKDWLTKRFKRQWLMMIDNADDTQLFFHVQQETVRPQCERLGRYIPECAHGSILVTTRNKQAGLRLARGKPPIEVGNMTSHETNELVRTILENNGIPDEEISGLATRLENLPLALTQAASFIHENGITIDDYIVLLDKSDATLVECLSEPFETVGRDSDTPHAVTATWIISFEQIEKQDRFAGEVLSLISLLDRQAIPRQFIVNYWQRERVAEADESSQEVRITKALGTLKAFCFISEAKDQSLDMHRLVQLVARKWLAIKGKMAEFAQHALKTVSDTYPYGVFETREVCLKYLPHAHAVLENKITGRIEGREERARLLHCVAGYFDFEGRWKEAEQYQVGAAKLRIEVLGEEHPDTLTVMANLASTYSDQGRWKEAEELEVDVMEIRKRVLGKEHPDTLTSMANLASTYRNQGRWKEAEELEVDVKKISKRVLGEEHPDTLTSMGNLALTYSSQGRWKEAEELQVDVMEKSKRVLGEEHPHTLTSMANLALTYSDQGRWKEAEEVEVDVKEISKRVMGEEHPDTLASMGNLALTYSNLGRWKEAEELQVDVIEMRKRVLGEEHPDTLTIMNNLASTYRNQGRWKEAEALGVDMKEISKRVMGEEHPDTLTSMGNLALTYSNLGRWKEAEELQVDVMEKSKRVLGEEHPHTLTSMANLAFTWKYSGRTNDALSLMRCCVVLRQRVLGTEHPHTISSVASLAEWESTNDSP